MDGKVADVDVGDSVGGGDEIGCEVGVGDEVGAGGGAVAGGGDRGCCMVCDCYCCCGTDVSGENCVCDCCCSCGHVMVGGISGVTVRP